MVRAIAALSLLLASQATEPVRTRYFATFVGKELPLRLTGELPSEQAARARGASYYVATYEAGRIVAVRKFLASGALQYEHRYAYGAEGHVVRATIVEAGERSEWVLKDGRLVRAGGGGGGGR